ncbi:MAG: hypothetical protein WA956_10325 [Stenotrophomonas sp.]
MSLPPDIPPQPLPPLPPPRRTAVAARPNRGYGGLFKLLVIITGLLLLAAYLGQRKPAAAQASATTVEEAAQATPTAAMTRKPQGGTPPPAAPQDARFSVSSDGLELRIDGDVGLRFATDLNAALAAHPSLQRIIITSGGGYAGPGLEAARQISRRNLIVRVRSHCASMCVGLWAAAAARELEPDAVIGLHQWRAPCARLPPEERRECEYTVQFLTQHDAVYDAWLRSAGFNARLLALQETTSADDLAVLGAPQLWENGVDFTAVDAEGRRMSREQVRDFLIAKYRSAGQG